jgi:hypothetical protein
MNDVFLTCLFYIHLEMSRYNLRERRQRIDYCEELSCDSLNSSNEQINPGYKLSKEMDNFKKEIHFKILKHLKHRKSINRHFKIQISHELMGYMRKNFEITKRFRSNVKFMKEFELEDLKVYFEKLFCIIVKQTFFVRFSTESKVNCFMDEQRTNRVILHSPFSYCCIKFCVDSASN